MEISRLWAGMLTRDLVNAETDSSITLSINIDGAERLPPHTLQSRTQRDQNRGEANLYEVNVEGRNIVPEELDPSSIRVSILGRDAWRPEHFMVWGERVSLPGGLENIPMAIETEITTPISADPNEGPSSFPLRPVGRGNRNMQINRLFMLMTTGGSPGGGVLGTPDSFHGSISPLEIQIVSEENLVALFEFRGIPERHLRSGNANFYAAPVIVPFTRSKLDDSSITLRLKGFDGWEAAGFFLFGLDTQIGRPEFLVPLVHLPEWPHGIMQGDAASGVASVTLPLVPDRSAPGNGGVVVAP